MGLYHHFGKWRRGSRFLISFHADTVVLLILLKNNTNIHFLIVNQTLPIHRLIFLSLTFKIIDKQP